MNRDFDEWLKGFRKSIRTYDYYVNFDKVYKNVDAIRVELNIMNSLIGSQNIEDDFRELVQSYPEVLKCVPTLLAVREKEIFAANEDGSYVYDFKDCADSVDRYVTFMQKTGLFDLISKHLVNNLFDYATGVETGLDSNGRKNRGGTLMEELLERYIKETDLEYYKEMYLSEIEEKWDLDLSSLSNNGKTEKRFDYVVKAKDGVYAFETNFYASGGSKLNETARSYKLLAKESKDISNFTFVWVTDGKGWESARNNLRETFEETEYIYNIVELEGGALDTLFNEEK